MSSLSAFTPGTWKFTSVYPRYGTSIPPDPSISNNCHNCWHGRPSLSTKLFKIDEMFAPKSIHLVTSCPSILTLVSLTLPINQYNGSRLVYFPSPLLITPWPFNFVWEFLGPSPFLEVVWPCSSPSNLCPPARHIPCMCGPSPHICNIAVASVLF